MEHSISEVARLAGLSSRTLRHYDDIGLLRPARVGANGYRWYGRPELGRLQRILLLRELRVALPQIRQVLDGASDELSSLRAHRDQLVGERRRLDDIVATVDKTIADLEGTADLDDQEFFAGLDRRRSALRDDLVARYGSGVEEHFAHGETVTVDWSRTDHEHAAQEGRRLLRRLAAARAAGSAPADSSSLDLMAEHYRGVRKLWPADAQAYHALADVILDNPDERAMVAEADPELAPWFAAAIRAYARERLGYFPGPSR